MTPVFTLLVEFQSELRDASGEEAPLLAEEEPAATRPEAGVVLVARARVVVVEEESAAP